MRVVALLSGGKDSVAAIEVAQNHGWQVVACLSIHPAEDDAWMFHTPNLQVVRGVAECLGIPLHEHPSRTGQTEEEEDLEAALRKVRQATGAQGIVSGALASEYQRTRIDRIGHRLGMPSFAPLWHKEPKSYLRSLVDGGYDIRFSRVAAEGLGAAWAGRRLDQGALRELEANPARPHVAGEGGEYETLVLDAPHYARRLVIDKAVVQARASRADWVVQQWHTEAKPGPLLQGGHL